MQAIKIHQNNAKYLKRDAYEALKLLYGLLKSLICITLQAIEFFVAKILKSIGICMGFHQFAQNHALQFWGIETCMEFYFSALDYSVRLDRYFAKDKASLILRKGAIGWAIWKIISQTKSSKTTPQKWEADKMLAMLDTEERN